MKMFEGQEHSFSDEEKRRLGFLDEKPELFQTRLLKVVHDGQAERDIQKRILFLTRDPGSANALLPLLHALNRDQAKELDIITDGIALEKIRSELRTQDMTPSSALAIPEQLQQPDLLITDFSVEPGIERFAVATYPEVPFAYLQGFYSDNRMLREFSDRKGLRLPDTACVLDAWAKRSMEEVVPELADCITITGNPAFDTIAQEDTAAIQKNVKASIGISADEPLLLVVSAPAAFTSPVIRALGEELQTIKNSPAVIHSIHLKDPVPFSEYRKALNYPLERTQEAYAKFSHQQIIAASDIVLTTFSTDMIAAVYRRKAVVHLLDETSINSSYLSPVNVKYRLGPMHLGASVGIKQIHQLADLLPQLFDRKSPLFQQLLDSMERNYPNDGKSTQRVEAVVKKLMV